LLSAEGYKVVLVGHGAAVDQAQQIRAKVRGQLLDVTGQTSVAQMASLLKRSYLLISNDSGPVHIAAAAGIYVISLFLRNQPGINPERWRPLGSKGFILSNKPEEAVRLDQQGGIASGLKGSIQVHDVLELANRLLQKP
jgi:heptosyltransferase II